MDGEDDMAHSLISSTKASKHRVHVCLEIYGQLTVFSFFTFQEICKRRQGQSSHSHHGDVIKIRWFHRTRDFVRG